MIDQMRTGRVRGIRISRISQFASHLPSRKISGFPVCYLEGSSFGTISPVAILNLIRNAVRNMESRARLLRVGGLLVDRAAYRIESPGGWVSVKPRTMAVLTYLAQHPGQVCPRRDIMDTVWGNAEVSDDVLNQAIRQLREAFDDDPRHPLFIETIPRGGYRLVADVEAASTRAHRPWLRWVTAIAVLLVSLGLALWIAVDPYPGKPPRQRLAVLPFESIGEQGSLDYLADGFTEELITELYSVDIEQLAVIARTSVMHFKDGATPLADFVNRLDLDYVVEGSVRREAEQLRITVQLIRADELTHLWAKRYDAPLRNILDLQQQVVRDIADQLRVSLGFGLERQADEVDPVAYRHFLRGRQFFYHFSWEGYQKAREELKKAVELSPDHAAAHAWLGLTYSAKAFGEDEPAARAQYAGLARQAAERAIELDAQQGTAHLVLAWLAFTYEWDWEQAKLLFQRGLDFAPNSWWLHWGYGELLSALGRHEKAIEQMRLANELDPVNPFTTVELAAVYNHAGKFGKARNVLRSALEVLPNHQELHDRLTVNSEHMGRYEDAISARQAHALLLNRPYDAEAHRSAYADHGPQGYWQWLLENPDWRDSDLNHAKVLTHLGRHEEALAILEDIVAARHPGGIVYIGVYPSFRPLHDEPRFRDLLRQMGLHAYFSNE